MSLYQVDPCRSARDQQASEGREQPWDFSSPSRMTVRSCNECGNYFDAMIGQFYCSAVHQERGHARLLGKAPNRVPRRESGQRQHVSAGAAALLADRARARKTPLTIVEAWQQVSERDAECGRLG
jgi:hypothetical protein